MPLHAPTPYAVALRLVDPVNVTVSGTAATVGRLEVVTTYGMQHGWGRVCNTRFNATVAQVGRMRCPYARICLDPTA